jgi:hypothetical protein
MITSFNSPELKAQVSYSDRPLSVCLSVRASVRLAVYVCELLHFRLLFQNRWASFNQTCHKSSLGEGDLSLFKWRAEPFCKGIYYNSERVQIHKKYWKIFFSKTSGPISIKLNANYPWIKGIQMVRSSSKGR